MTPLHYQDSAADIQFKKKNEKKNFYIIQNEDMHQSIPDVPSASSHTASLLLNTIRS